MHHVPDFRVIPFTVDICSV